MTLTNYKQRKCPFETPPICSTFLHLPLETSQAFPFHPNSGLPRHCRVLSTLLCICVRGVCVATPGAPKVCVSYLPREHVMAAATQWVPNKHLATI